jgi:hypothetical protein
MRCIWSANPGPPATAQAYREVRAEERVRRSAATHIGRSARLFLTASTERYECLRVGWAGAMGDVDMQIILGMILGVLITIGAAFVCDTTTGRAANGLTVASVDGRAPIVNWDVVSHDWDGMKFHATETLRRN